MLGAFASSAGPNCSGHGGVVLELLKLVKGFLKYQGLGLGLA